MDKVKVYVSEGQTDWKDKGTRRLSQILGQGESLCDRETDGLRTQHKGTRRLTQMLGHGESLYDRETDGQTAKTNKTVN